jgi:hypothetical protein
MPVTLVLAALCRPYWDEWMDGWQKRPSVGCFSFANMPASRIHRSSHLGSYEPALASVLSTGLLHFPFWMRHSQKPFGVECFLRASRLHAPSGIPTFEAAAHRGSTSLLDLELM